MSGSRSRLAHQRRQAVLFGRSFWIARHLRYCVVCPFAAFGVCLLCDDRGEPGNAAVSRALVDSEPDRHLADFSSLVLPLGCDRHAPRCSTSSDLQNILRPYRAIETGRLIPWSTVVTAINQKAKEPDARPCHNVTRFTNNAQGIRPIYFNVEGPTNFFGKANILYE